MDCLLRAGFFVCATVSCVYVCVYSSKFVCPVSRKHTHAQHEDEMRRMDRWTDDRDRGVSPRMQIDPRKASIHAAAPCVQLPGRLLPRKNVCAWYGVWNEWREREERRRHAVGRTARQTNVKSGKANEAVSESISQSVSTSAGLSALPGSY